MKKFSTKFKYQQSFSKFQIYFMYVYITYTRSRNRTHMLSPATNAQLNQIFKECRLLLS